MCTTWQIAGIAFFIPEFYFVGGFCQVCQETTPSSWGKSPLPETKRHNALSPIADPHLSVPFQFEDLGKNTIILYLYGSNGSWVALQHGHRGAGSKTPDSHDFVAAARGQQRVLVVHGHVGNLSRVSSQRGEQAPVICSPDFDQTIIWPLMPHKNFQRLSERICVMCAKYTGTAQTNMCRKHPRAMNLPEEQLQWDSAVSDFGDHLRGHGSHCLMFHTKQWLPPLIQHLSRQFSNNYGKFKEIKCFVTYYQKIYYLCELDQPAGKSKWL